MLKKDVICLGIALIGHFIFNRIPQSLLDAAKSLIDCGIANGYIEKDYQIVGHQYHGIAEFCSLNFNRSHQTKTYCGPINKTSSSN